MKLEEARLIRSKLEEILKEEEKVTKMYFYMTIIASQTGAEKTYQDMTDIGEKVGAHQDKTKQLIARFKAEDTRIRRQMELLEPRTDIRQEIKTIRARTGYKGHYG